MVFTCIALKQNCLKLRYFLTEVHDTLGDHTHLQRSYNTFLLSTVIVHTEEMGSILRVLR